MGPILETSELQSDFRMYPESDHDVQCHVLAQHSPRENAQNDHINQNNMENSHLNTVKFT